MSYMRKDTISSVCILLTVSILTQGCAAWRAINPFDSVASSDAEWSGVKSGEVVGLTPTLAGALDDRASALASLLSAFGQSDPVGVILPISLPGEAETRWILCVDDFKEKCRQIPLHAEVHFAGKSAGIFWKPSRLTAKNFND